MRAAVAGLLVVLVLAGCASDPPPQEGPDDEIRPDLKATSTTGVIRGVVVTPSIVPIPNATVSIDNLDRQTLTAADGTFGFEKVEPGSYFLSASKAGHNATQAFVTVEAGVDRPRAVTIMLPEAPGTMPRVVPATYNGYLACGAAIIATSVGCTVWGPLADATESVSIWLHEFQDKTVQWTQGELVWTHNQAAGGMLIWEITARRNDYEAGCHRETTVSPALAYCPSEWLHNDPNANNDALAEGITYRFFGGPHPTCSGVFFGCGLTIDQAATAYIHDFYNMEPDEGWRFTVDGDHPLPP